MFVSCGNITPTYLGDIYVCKLNIFRGKLTWDKIRSGVRTHPS